MDQRGRASRSVGAGWWGIAIAWLSTGVAGSGASADEMQFTGRVETDFRASVDGADRGDLILNLNTVQFNVRQRLNPHIRYEADLRVNFDGLSLAGAGHGLDGLTNAAVLDPFWLESDAAYVTIRNAFEGFDIVFGRQIVTWGASDRFRPTNNLNPDDMWDPLRFGMTQANEMVRLVYAPTGSLVLEAVVVPAFRPARLPTSAAAALTDTNAPIPFIEGDLVDTVRGLRESMAGWGFTFGETTAQVDPPDLSLENVQVGARMSWRGFDSDWSLSYYRGFHDFPVPRYSESSLVQVRDEPDGPVRNVVENRAELHYPSIQVFGFDVAGQIPFLDNAGFRFEGAVVWPDADDVVNTMQLPRQSGMDFGRFTGYAADPRPFLKTTFGLDYTWTRDIFTTIMWVHGMVDELGASNLGDYVVVGGDFKFFNHKLMLRLFALAQLSLDTPSFSIMPVLQWNPWSSMEMELGGLVLWGPERAEGYDRATAPNAWSKFGQPAAGSSLVFLRTRVRF